MSKDLKMEIFASKETVKPDTFHVYKFHTSELYGNKFKLISKCHLEYKKCKYMYIVQEDR